MFDNLTKRLGGVFDSLFGRAKITEADIEKAFREIRIALLEADVPLQIAKDLVERIKEKALGEEVIKSVSPTEQIIKITNDEIVNLLSDEKNNEIDFTQAKPFVILMAGLQGTGKTTSAAKIAKVLQEKHNKKVLLASLDIYRPAAQEQLKILGDQINAASLPIIEGQNVSEITKRALKEGKDYDVIILDTAGRLNIDEKMMDEIKEVAKIASPNEILLTADAMLGQQSIEIAKSFKEAVNITGIVLTRMDGDARGGALLAMKYITGAPVKFVGTGEKIEDFEKFYPDRAASRILGMGDVVTLVEKAQDKIDEEDAKQMAEKMFAGHFNFNDMLKQIRMMKKMGSLKGILKLIPGISKMQDQIAKAGVNDDMIKKQEAIILSMTKKERQAPDIILASRKKRIAKGAGVKLKDVENVLKNYNKMKNTMKKVNQMGGMEAIAEKLKNDPGQI
jgi:signal recognition particle subunit SRP54